MNHLLTALLSAAVISLPLVVIATPTASPGVTPVKSAKSGPHARTQTLQAATAKTN